MTKELTVTADADVLRELFPAAFQDIELTGEWIRQHIKPRICCSLEGRALYLSTTYMWTLERDNIGVLCLVPRPFPSPCDDSKT